MKKSLIILLLAGCGLCFAQCNANAQDRELKSHISKQFTPSNAASATVLGVYNVFGSVKVEGYSGDKIQIEIDQTISSKYPQELETAKTEFKLGFEQNGDSILAYTQEPYNTNPRNGRYDDKDKRKIKYTVNLEYTIKVPYNINLRASTVNDGDVDVKNVYGTLHINNVNGLINIENAKGTTNARTINGNLTVTYLSVPPEASSYYTLNGKLEVSYPSALAADLEFKSMNGEFFTSFTDAETLPSEVVKTQDKRANGTTYKLNSNSRVRVGAGGKLFKFETLNGNIYIKKS